MENLLQQGLLSPQRLSELKIYAKLLDDDSVAPKQKILEAIRYMEDEQKKIAAIQQRAQLMQQRAQQFLMEGPEGQAQQIADARAQLQQQEQPIKGEAEVKAAEKKLKEPKVKEK